jgi:hypothetical protein
VHLANEIIGQVQSLDPRFSPTGAAAPRHYRLVFHSLGFQAAEKLAAVVRRKFCAPPSDTKLKRFTR